MQRANQDLQASLRRQEQQSRSKQSQEVGLKDVRRAADGLSAMGKGFEVIHTGKKRIICSVASELNEDHKMLFKLAEQSGGWFSRSSAKSELQFDEQRFQRDVHATMVAVYALAPWPAHLRPPDTPGEAPAR